MQRGGGDRLKNILALTLCPKGSGEMVIVRLAVEAHI